jgi:hypothetical protein
LSKDRETRKEETVYERREEEMKTIKTNKREKGK